MCMRVYVFMVVGDWRSQKTGYHIFAEEAGNCNQEQGHGSCCLWGALWRTGSLTGSGELSGDQIP